MRAIWKGAVSFGLVNVPVRLYSATQNHDLSFHQVRESDGSRIRLRRVAQADGEEVAYRDIAKAYVTDDGKTVILTDEDLKSLPNRSSKEIAVESFVPADQIDPILFDKAYYIEPDSSGAKAYGLLREALRESDRMAVVTISVRTRMTMAVLRVAEEAIVLQTLLWPDEVRSVGELNHLDEATEPKESEKDMARMLVESMAGDFEPDNFEDDYQKAVEDLVKAKIEGGEATQAPATEEEESGEVVDLLAALQRSVDRARDSREASSGEGKGSAKKSTAKDNAAKKSPTEKGATKKSRSTNKDGSALEVEDDKDSSKAG